VGVTPDDETVVIVDDVVDVKATPVTARVSTQSVVVVVVVVVVVGGNGVLLNGVLLVGGK